MLLQQLKLQNIRSYSNETVNFPEGSTLLSGDIGSGKSTILLAIEFALFGTSRTDLPGEALLRKGATQGSVELKFKLADQEIIIKRALKKEREKEKEVISQTAGYIIINDIKKELTPVELKAEIVSLLGYPEEFITKNKNYIFRYTVYTPQEEIKSILEETSEIRLDTLRKIFNIDKYKIIRENLQTYLKQMRSNLAVLEEKISPLEEQKLHLQQLEEEKKQLEQKLAELLPKINQFIQLLEEEQKEENHLEQQQKRFLELKQSLRMLSLLLEEKKNQSQQLWKKLEQLNFQISMLNFPPEYTAEQTKEEIKKLEEQKNIYWNKKNSGQEKVKSLQSQIIELKQENVFLTGELEKVPEKEQLREKLLSEVEQKEIWKEKKQQLAELLEKIVELIVKNQTLLEQSHETEKNMLQLKHCPTCLQDVSPEHREKILTQEKNKLKQAETLLAELRKKKEEISQQKQQFQEKLDEAVKKENLLTKIKAELLFLEEKRKKIQQNQEKLKLLVQENNLLMNQLMLLDNEPEIPLIEKTLAEKRELLHHWEKKKMLEQQIQEHSQLFSQSQEQREQLTLQLKQSEQELSEKEDLTLKLQEKKQKIQDIRKDEKELAIQQAQFRTQLLNVQKQEQQLQEKLALLLEEKNKLLRFRELYHWLEEYFLNLTVTIEKRMMLNINRQFNQLFQEMFSTLIEDESVFSRLDDSFNPIIEQNGYEVAFSNLSGGEKTSAALAYRLALNKVINDIVHEIKTKDLLILDEPTDGFSSEQLDKVRDVLEKLNLRQTIIVSHESKIETFVENVIRIGKNEHVSVVVD